MWKGRKRTYDFIKTKQYANISLLIGKPDKKFTQEWNYKEMTKKQSETYHKQLQDLSIDKPCCYGIQRPTSNTIAAWYGIQRPTSMQRKKRHKRSYVLGSPRKEILLQKIYSKLQYTAIPKLREDRCGHTVKII